MNFFDNMQAKARINREARRKAERDIDLVKQFFEVHNDNPEDAIAVKFFTSLGDDVTKEEGDVYRKITEKFQAELAASGRFRRTPVAPSSSVGFAFPIDEDGNPEFPADMPEELRAALSVVLLGLRAGQPISDDPEILADSYLRAHPGIDQSHVDEMAQDHGHDTREDECEGLVVLRRKIDERDGKK